MRPPVALTIAGTDSSGGAGVLADAATFRAHGVWPTAAVTAVTAQDTVGVHAVQAVGADVVAAQIDAVRRDIRPDAAKTGMLGGAEVVEVVARAWRGDPAPLVIDPVLRATTGAALLDAAAVGVLLERLLPLAALVTPNLAEAAALTGLPVEDRPGMVAAGQALRGMGAAAVLVTGGHLAGDMVADCLVTADGVRWFTGRRLATPHTHGTGCVLSAAVAARLARGDALGDAVVGARRFVRRAIRDGGPLGQGAGPVAPGAPSWRAW